MKSLWRSGLIALGACLLAGMGTTARGADPAGSAGGVPKSKADRPTRKVVVGTVVYGPYGPYPGLGERLKVLGGLVDAMAEEAARAVPGHGLDLAVLPETTVTDTHGAAARRAIPLRGPVLETFASLA